MKIIFILSFSLISFVSIACSTRGPFHNEDAVNDMLNPNLKSSTSRADILKKFFGKCFLEDTNSRLSFKYKLNRHYGFGSARFSEHWLVVFYKIDASDRVEGFGLSEVEYDVGPGTLMGIEHQCVHYGSSQDYVPVITDSNQREDFVGRAVIVRGEMSPTKDPSINGIGVCVDSKSFTQNVETRGVLRKQITREEDYDPTTQMKSPGTHYYLDIGSDGYCARSVDHLVIDPSCLKLREKNRELKSIQCERYPETCSVPLDTDSEPNCE